MAKEVWKKSYGDGELTDDYVLWLNGKPTDIVISGWTSCYWLMQGRQRLYLGTTIKECKEAYKEINPLMSH